jgi:arginase
LAKRFFSVPYDSGHRGVRMGAGPLRLVEALGIEADEIEPATEFRSEIKTTFELYRALAARVAESAEVPVVFSGHCGAATAVASGVGVDDLALLWFDAHGDYNTPDTTDTGFLDGMCLAVLTGRGWKKLARTIPGFAPLDPRRVVHSTASQERASSSTSTSTCSTPASAAPITTLAMAVSPPTTCCASSSWRSSASPSPGWW